MSVVNYGSQIITYDYKNVASGDAFNKRMAHSIKPGVYRISSPISNVGNAISIPTFTMGFAVGTDKFVHISTGSTINLTADESNGDTLICSYTWADTIDNFIDFAWRAWADPPITNEIILCKVTYSAGIIDSLDNTVQTKGIFIDSTYNVIVDTAMSVGKNSNPSGTLDVDGTLIVDDTTTLNGLKKNVTSKTGTYTATSTDNVILCNGAFTINLPAVASSTELILDIVNTGTGLITIDGNASETINGNITFILEQYESVSIVCDGSAWYII